MAAEPAGDELSLVLADLTAGLGARAAAVLLDVGGGRPRLLGAHGSVIAIDRLPDRATRAIGALGDGLRWMTDEDGDLLLAPVRSDGGQGRLAIAATFARIGPEGRATAERAYTRVAPLVGACLRLWLAARAGAATIRSLQAALDWSGLGVILLDAAGEILFANDAACALLDAGDGLRRLRNRVVTRDLGDTVQLQLAIDRVVTAGRGDGAGDGHDAPLLAIGRAGAPALILSVLPSTPAVRDWGDAAAILYVMDPARDVGELLRPVCRAYRLSPAEALLARHLVAGDTVTAAAARMGVKAMTARGYLKQVFLKTDTHRQPELVQLMLSSIIHTHLRGTDRAAAG